MLKKNEVFYLLIFIGIFLYFTVLKLTNNLDISWHVMLLPMFIAVLFYIAVSALTRYSFKCKK